MQWYLWKGVKLILNTHVQVPVLFLKSAARCLGLICAWAQGWGWSRYATESTTMAECVDPSIFFCSLDLLEFLFHSLTSVGLKLFRSYCLITGACVNFLTLLILSLDHGDSRDNLQRSCYWQYHAITVLLCLSIECSTELNTGLLLETCSTPWLQQHLLLIYVPSQGGKIQLNEDCNFTKFSILKRRKNIP